MVSRCIMGVNRLIPAHAGKTDALAQPCPPVEAHPRSRGENDVYRGRTGVRPGSSPLTRGKPYCLLLVRVRVGLIPAHAGKTRVPRNENVRRGAHPRSRGENSDRVEPTNAPAGSSPLTRGKRSAGDRVASPRGLIPAHAGETKRGGPRGIPARAHPRSRGENADQ